MMAPIPPGAVTGIQAPTLPQLGPAPAAGGTPTFPSLLGEAIRGVEQVRQTAHAGVEKFLAGENEDVHQTVMDVQKAELSFELFLQVRNKVVQAYQEVMRMQL
jgi:flagellar hook-basal body complex protein FliE